MSARGVMGLPSVRPFFALFARPMTSMAAWIVFMALVVAALHLGDHGFSLAFTGRPDGALEPAAFSRLGQQLVLHGVALVSMAIGMMAMLTAAELDASPRLALAPRFTESMRAGMLVLMVVPPALGWIWARSWAPGASLWLALAWSPFWFALGSWGRLLARTPRWVEAMPIALLVVLMFAPRVYLSAVETLGWPGAFIAMLLGPVGVISSWSPRVREIARLRSQRRFYLDALLFGWFKSPEVAWDARVVRPTSSIAWLRYLSAEIGATANRLVLRVLFLAAVLCFFVFLGHASPGLLGASVPPLMVAGRPLLYPLARRDRARLQFLTQFQDLGVYVIAALLGGGMASLIPVAWLPEDFDMSTQSVPTIVQLGAAVALWPVPQWKSLSAPIHSGDTASMARDGKDMLLQLAIGMLVYTLGVEWLSRAVWREADHVLLSTLGALAAVGAVAQLVWYVYLHWHFARTDLAPSEG